MEDIQYSKLTKSLIFAFGLFETLFFSGVIFGWADLLYTMKMDRIFSTLCNETKSSEVAVVTDCSAQDNFFDLVFTISVYFHSGSSLAIAWLLDSYGLRMSRLLSNVFIISGGYLIAYAKENNCLLLPGMILICLGGSQIRMNSFVIANLFPMSKSTIISIYNGASTASGGVFLLFKYGYQHKYDLKTMFTFWTGLSGIMFIPTMVLLPVKTIKSEGKENQEWYEKDSKGYSNGKCALTKDENNVEGSERLVEVGSESTKISVSKTTFCSTVTSLALTLHLLWAFMIAISLILYSGSFFEMVETTVSSQNSTKSATEDEISWLVELFGYSQLPMFFVAPLCGAVIDYYLYSARKVEDVQKKIKTARFGGFLCLTLTSLAMIGIYICILFRKAWTLKLSLLFYICGRPLANAVSVVYLRIRFPPEYFNKLFGIFATAVSLFGLLQFPLYMWSAKDYVATYSFLIILNVLALINPIYLMWTHVPTIR